MIRLVAVAGPAVASRLGRKDDELEGLAGGGVFEGRRPAAVLDKIGRSAFIIIVIYIRQGWAAQICAVKENQQRIMVGAVIVTGRQVEQALMGGGGFGG